MYIGERPLSLNNPLSRNLSSHFSILKVYGVGSVLLMKQLFHQFERSMVCKKIRLVAPVLFFSAVKFHEKKNSFQYTVLIFCSPFSQFIGLSCLVEIFHSLHSFMESGKLNSISLLVKSLRLCELANKTVLDKSQFFARSPIYFMNFQN